MPGEQRRQGSFGWPDPLKISPTPAELEVLKILWEHGPSTVREVMRQQADERAYTSVMSLLNVMTEKGLLRRRPQGRAFLYETAAEREATLGGMLRDMLGRAFEGSASAMVAHLLEQSSPDDEELSEIRRTIRHYKRQQET